MTVSLMHLLNWQLVRLLSSLSLLNRLAFSMLLIVPLLAALWTPMRNATQQYNDVVSQARKDIGIPPPEDELLEEVPEDELVPIQSEDATAAANDTEVDSAPSQDSVAGGSPVPSSEETAELPTDPPVVVDAVDQEAIDESSTLFILPPRVRAVLQTWFPRVVGKPELPRPWALAFFAALLILMGDTIVQIICPKVVRDFGREEYVRTETDSFSKAPSLLVLSRATSYLSELKTHPDLIQQEINATSGTTGSTDHEQSTAPSPHAKTPTQAEFDDLARRIAIVEAASRARYIALAETRRLGALMSMLCYLISGCVIIKILQEQAVNVARASGWTN